MNGILHRRHALHFPYAENDGVLETAGRLALLHHPGFRVASRGQAHFDGESSLLANDARERVGVDDPRAIGFDVDCSSVSLRHFFFERDVPEHPAPHVLEDLQVLGQEGNVEHEDGAHLLGGIALRFLDLDFKLLGRIGLGKQLFRDVTQQEGFVAECLGDFRDAGQQFVACCVVDVGA